MKANKLNRLYAEWTANSSDKTLGKLLEAVRLRTSKRFARLVEDDQGNRGPLDSQYEDIASETMISVWRSLPGYTGKDPLKVYVDDGNFASFVRTAGRYVRKNIVDLYDNSKVSHYDPIDMEYIQAGLEQGYEDPEPDDFWEEIDDEI